MSFDDALEVAPAKSPFSTRATRRPCALAASAMPAPTIPPPITSRSKRVEASRSSWALRFIPSRVPLPGPTTDDREVERVREVVLVRQENRVARLRVVDLPEIEEEIAHLDSEPLGERA